jgi:hypothetical protein
MARGVGFAKSKEVNSMNIAPSLEAYFAKLSKQ